MPGRTTTSARAEADEPIAAAGRAAAEAGPKPWGPGPHTAATASPHAPIATPTSLAIRIDDSLPVGPMTLTLIVNRLITIEHHSPASRLVKTPGQYA